MLVVPVMVVSSEAPLSLTLNDAIRMAVEKNLDVRAELYNPAQFEADINRNRSIYDPLLNLQSNFTDSTTATVDSRGIFVKSQALSLNSSINQLLWTGGTAAITFNNGYTNSNFVTPPSSWQTG